MRRLGCPLSQGARGFAHPEPIGVTPLDVPESERYYQMAKVRENKTDVNKLMNCLEFM